MDAIVIFRPLRSICILVRTRILFCFMYDLDLCMYIWILDSWSLRGCILYLLWVPSWTCVMLLPWFHPHNVYVVTCTFCLVGVSKATSCELWRDCYNSQGADFGASHLVSLSWWHRTLGPTSSLGLVSSYLPAIQQVSSKQGFHTQTSHSSSLYVGILIVSNIHFHKLFIISPDANLVGWNGVAL
jgi:hypothetical protein